MDETDTNSFETIYPFWNLLKDIVLLLNQNGEIEFANHAYLDLIQSSLEEVQNKSLPWCSIEWESLSDIIENKGKHIIFFDVKECLSDQNITLQFVQKFCVADKQYYLFQQLQSSQESQFSKALLNSTDIAFIYVNSEFIVESFNRAAHQVAEALFKKELLLGITFQEYLQDVTGKDSILGSLSKALAGKFVLFSQEFPGDGPNNLWYEFQFNPIASGISPAGGAAIVIRDISKYKYSEQEIRKSEEIFRNMFANINDPALLWQKKADGEIVLLTYNAAAGQISDGKFNEWIGATLESYYGDQSRPVELVHEVFTTGQKQTSELFFQLVTTAEKRWFFADYIKISNDYLLNILKDITERKNAEIALNEKQRQYETLLKNLPGMVYRCRNDEHWTMEFVNDGSYDLLGYHPHELVNNQAVSYGSIIHPEDRDKIWAEIQTSLLLQRNFELTYRVITRSNDIKWVWERGQSIPSDQGEMALLEGFITDVTERILFENKAEKARRQAEALQEAMAELASELELSQVLRRILVTLKKVLEYDSATLFLKINGNLKVVAARGFTNTSRLIDKTFPADNKLLIEIQKRNEPIILEDAQKEPMFESWEGANLVRGWMGVPLYRHGQFIGFMTIDSYTPGSYNQDDAVLARTFADEAAIVIENARLYEHSQSLATLDGLTGIHNRRYFYEASSKEFERCKRYGNPMSLIMIDIDHFKFINDRYGHSAGDQVLIQFIERVKKELRGTDLLARYGGEEFSIMLLESDVDQAFQVAERIRDVTAREPFDLPDARPYITISLGVATLDESTATLDMLIDRSDKALYESKQFGRNRVRIWKA